MMRSDWADLLGHCTQLLRLGDTRLLKLWHQMLQVLVGHRGDPLLDPFGEEVRNVAGDLHPRRSSFAHCLGHGGGRLRATARAKGRNPPNGEKSSHLLEGLSNRGCPCSGAIGRSC